MHAKDKKAERLLILIAWSTMAIAMLSWFGLRSFPSIRTGITFSIFGCGFLALSFAGIRTGVIAWRLGAVYRSEETLFFWVLIYGEIVAGVLMIVFGWCL